MRKKICVVDDDSFYAEILASLLAMQGFESQHYASAAECLGALAASSDPEPYDAFILDVVMPDMDGYTLCENLRSRPRFAKTPVLFVSSKNTLEDRMRGYEAGGNDYLGKPVQPDELKIKLELAIKHVASQKAQAIEAQTQARSSQAEYLNQVAAFLENSVDISSHLALGDALLNQIMALGLAGSLTIRHDSNHLFMASDGSEHAIEKELLQLSVKNQPLIEFNQRLIVNTAAVSVLVRRLPTEGNPELLKQQLLVLTRIANLRADSISREQAERRQKKYWVELLVAAEKGVTHSNSDLYFKDNWVSETLEEFVISTNENLLDLALDADQEAALKAYFRKQIDQLAITFKSYNQSIDEARRPFQELIEKLRS